MRIHTWRLNLLFSFRQDPGFQVRIWPVCMDTYSCSDIHVFSIITLVQTRAYVHMHWNKMRKTCGQGAAQIPLKARDTCFHVNWLTSQAALDNNICAVLRVRGCAREKHATWRRCGMMKLAPVHKDRSRVECKSTETMKRVRMYHQDQKLRVRKPKLNMNGLCTSLCNCDLPETMEEGLVAGGRFESF